MVQLPSVGRDLRGGRPAVHHLGRRRSRLHGRLRRPTARSSTRASSGCVPGGRCESLVRFAEKAAGLAHAPGLTPGRCSDADQRVPPLDRVPASRQGRRRRCAVARPRACRGPLLPRDAALRRTRGTASSPRTDVRAGRDHRHSRHRGGGGGAREIIALPGSSPGAQSAASPSPSISKRASSTSTTSRSTTSRRCPSAGSRTAAGADPASRRQWRSSPNCAGSP